MAHANLLQKYQKASLAYKRQEGDGNEIQAEVREDEEQSVKLQEIIDLLLAAGYFRVRIKGLSPFDKVIGGMTWCIESLNVDVDVDLLFQENSTIGQQIALSEKIVAVLPKIKCPHRIEPHQIQGLDFIHIFPVIQWLVKVSIEARQEKAAFVRSYAINQYEKTFASKTCQNTESDIQNNIKTVEEFYRPKRHYKRKNVPPPDILSRVQITLLEYGFRGGAKSKQSSEQGSKNTEGQDDSITVEDNEQNNIEQLLSNLVAAKEEILLDDDLTEEDKKAVVKHYESLHSELKDGGQQSKEEQQLFILIEQDKLLENSISNLNEKRKNIEEQMESENRILQETKVMQLEAEKTLKEFAEEVEQNASAVKEIEDLVLLNDSLKSQEATFKENCKKELVKLQKEIEEFRQILSPVELTPEQSAEIEKLSDKIRSIKLQVAKKNQIVSRLQRQLDDVPNRAEMAQYQRRFLELYNQVAAKHKETKQYYTLYNTLEDKRRYMQKELSLLNSVVENYPRAMESASSKRDFLEQLQNIVDGVKQNRFKIQKQVTEQKKKRDQLFGVFQNLLELQRSYATAVKQLSLECKNYEQLLNIHEKIV